jgi:hypothetical protein
MPTGEKKEAKLACTCNACELTLADGKATLHMLCGCEDCRQARASYSAAVDRGLRPRRFGGGAPTSGADTTASCGLRPRPICFAIVERRSE